MVNTHRANLKKQPLPAAFSHVWWCLVPSRTRDTKAVALSSWHGGARIGLIDARSLGAQCMLNM
eukprot:2460648-Lingulodinium_polyedra.AAC.1